ncbi:hypothetical protein DS843_30265 [Roseomonas genomospecies 6]|uniref:Uncharacterized protein n=1 Tax=Roseomonas genomospecies 6 TaxID=214106 RepID=A0A9W7KMY2_9PROT|nr:hypothetical protein DS843_30265 [Roseomonas genomospecies 6]
MPPAPDRRSGPAVRLALVGGNRPSKPFVWTKPADAILAKLARLPAPFEWVSVPASGARRRTGAKGRLTSEGAVDSRHSCQ